MRVCAISANDGYSAALDKNAEYRLCDSSTEQAILVSI